MIDLWAELVGAENHWKWLSLAVLLGLAELVVPGVFLIWIAAAAALVGVITLILGVPVEAQLLLFAILSAGAVYAGRRWYRDNPIDSEDPLLNDRTTRMIGQIVEVVEDVTETGGRAKVGDSVWPARGPALSAGTRARIAAVKDGVISLEAVS
ncbi:MAG: NfeD family protein [Blastomonas sp.]